MWISLGTRSLWSLLWDPKPTSGSAVPASDEHRASLQRNRESFLSTAGEDSMFYVNLWQLVNEHGATTRTFTRLWGVPSPARRCMLLLTFCPPGPHLEQLSTLYFFIAIGYKFTLVYSLRGKCELSGYPFKFSLGSLRSPHCMSGDPSISTALSIRNICDRT